ncbi:MAG: AMP-binding protein [Microthrixaceae bacterium]
MGSGFGTTETGVITLYIIGSVRRRSGTVPSGYAVEEVEMSILDDSGDPAPNEQGEIVVSSPHVFAGYWGHDELNELVLEPDRLGREGWFTSDR